MMAALSEGRTADHSGKFECGGTSGMPPHGFHTIAERLRRFPEQAELRQGCDAVVETDFLDDLAVPELQHGGPRETHLAAAVGRQASDQEVGESRTGMGAAARPAADDSVAFRDQVGGAPKIEI